MKEMRNYWTILCLMSRLESGLNLPVWIKITPKNIRLKISFVLFLRIILRILDKLNV